MSIKDVIDRTLLNNQIVFQSKEITIIEVNNLQKQSLRIKKLPDISELLFYLLLHYYKHLYIKEIISWGFGVLGFWVLGFWGFGLGLANNNF